MKVYKVPPGITIEQLKEIVGDQGTLLYPMIDNNGNIIISVEEWNAQEFQFIKDLYADKIDQFEIIDYSPVPIQKLPYRK